MKHIIYDEKNIRYNYTCAACSKGGRLVTWPPEETETVDDGGTFQMYVVSKGCFI